IDDEHGFVATRDLLRDVAGLDIDLEWLRDCGKASEQILKQEHDLYLLGCCSDKHNVDLMEGALRAGVEKPFILLTGSGQAELDARAIELGAADYLIKGQFDGQQLGRSVRYAIERSQATARLAESERRHRLMFEANPGSMWVFSKKSLRILAVNQAACDCYGYDQDELLRMSVLDIRSLQEQKRFLEVFPDSHLETITHADAGIWTLLHKDGHELQVSIRVHDFEFDNQPCCLALISDVTDKLKAREETKRRANTFIKLLGDLRDAVLVVDQQDGAVFYANPSAEQLLRATPQQLLQQNYDIPCSHAGLYECLLPRLDGEPVAVEIHCAETEWEGRPARLLSLRDITL